MFLEILFALLWVFGGIYCAFVHWLKDFDVKGKDFLVLVLCGIIIGPIIGFFDCIGKLLEVMAGKWWNKVLIKRNGRR